jgi:hypothetical protein
VRNNSKLGPRQESWPIYHVVFKARAAARFRRETEQIWFNVGLEPGPVQMRVRTRFTDEGHEAGVPRELFIEMRGPAAGMNLAIDTFGPFAAAVANVVAFSTNVAVHPIELYVAVDATPGLTEREFSQQYGPLESGFIGQGRAIHAQATGELFQLVASGGPELNHLGVALHHYAVALTRWETGGEAFVLNHLYTAAEALEKTIKAQESAALGIPEDQLYKPLGLPKNAVGAHYRRDVVFGGDRALYELVKATSDGFEHGSLSIAEAQAQAKKLCPTVFGLIRTCVLGRLGATQELRDILLGEKYRWPLDPSRRRIVDGTFVGTGDQMGPPGYNFPYLAWDTMVSALTFDDADDLQAQVKENFRVHSADGGLFRARGIRMYGRALDPNNPPKPTLMQPISIETGKVPIEDP